MSIVLDRATPTARKEHICQSCGRRIVPGEKYVRVTSISDNGWQTWKACQQCDEVAGDLWDADYRGDDEDGNECYPYLPEVDWHEVASWSPLWALRAERYRKQWDGKAYPRDFGEPA